MDQRQTLALTEPLARANGDPRLMRRFTKDRKHATGLILRTILAVDR